MNHPFFNAGKASAQVVPEKYVILTKGYALILTCKVNEETIKVTWKKDGNSITERAVTKLDEKTSKLNLTEVVEEDSGEYSCEASNKLGNVARSVVTVDVKGKLFKELNIISVIKFYRYQRTIFVSEFIIKVRIKFGLPFRFLLL